MYEHQRHGLRDHKSEKKLRQQVLLGHKQWFCQGPCMCNKIKAPDEHGNECLRIASTYGRSFTQSLIVIKTLNQDCNHGVKGEQQIISSY